MKVTKPAITGFLAATMLFAAWGCGSGAPPVESSMREGTVKGTVKVKGKPVNGGTIIFQPSNPKRKTEDRKAKIGKDGTYTVQTLVGENNVIIEAPDVARAGLYAELIRYDVKEGEQTYDISLPQNQ
jgi:hypothetical protein